MRKLALLAAMTMAALLIATPASAKPTTTIIAQDDYSTLTLTEHGNRQAVTLTSTFPENPGDYPHFILVSEGQAIFIRSGETVILPKHTEVIYGGNTYPSLWLYEEGESCTDNTGICVHGEYGPGDMGNSCDVYAENPTDATVTVTLYDANGSSLGNFLADPGSTFLVRYDNARCPSSASVE